jgi:ATP-dependent exoDNAse (exonuclease V) beta subunit
MHDRVFQIIKETKHDQLMEEERRLFYVALTRAKDKLYLITEKGNESSFLNEIPEMYTVKSVNDSFPLIEKKQICKNASANLKNFGMCVRIAVSQS